MAIQELQRVFKTWAVLEEVEAERARQDEKWGEQNHPDLPGVRHPGYALAANMWKVDNAGRMAEGCLAWDGILLEEVFEALEQAELANEVGLRQELIQVAAVVVAHVEAIDRRAA